VRAVDGAFAEVLAPGPGIPNTGVPDSYFGVADRPGTYTVQVTAVGYRPWQRDSVVAAPEPGCHVQTVGLTALLERLPNQR
jgi:hypothetical protein